MKRANTDEMSKRGKDQAETSQVSSDIGDYLHELFKQKVAKDNSHRRR
jgi:hypothetical protein